VKSQLLVLKQNRPKNDTGSRAARHTTSPELFNIDPFRRFAGTNDEQRTAGISIRSWWNGAHS
jgi:hypothetical protein